MKQPENKSKDPSNLEGLESDIAELQFDEDDLEDLKQILREYNGDVVTDWILS